ncbi:hypothetical protein LC087_17820 [Bacillus carboniphilus]|uniref:Uncharacterized protein n=1 Tax=Bacillus carboniphilus TaxID=86663 RepID=A0ABY9JVK9_9BACI|nr:hypothetical protein [Bacillus carboniphilus]WLR42523.1 hypothetical protein LC087_17820 [Bacillus carboniphilus]
MNQKKVLRWGLMLLILFLTAWSGWINSSELSNRETVESSKTLSPDDNIEKVCEDISSCGFFGDQLIRELPYDFLDTQEVEDVYVEEKILARYKVQDGKLVRIVEGEGSEGNEELWRLFTQVIPMNQRQMIGEFGVFTDGIGTTLAYVEPLDKDPIQWTLRIDPADTTSFPDFIYTIVHEFGHLLTLKNSEIPIHEDSYLQLFMDQFWDHIYDEWIERDVFEDEDEQLKFYDNYPDKFVTDYAASHPEEDIAESWVYFVLGEKPTGEEIWEQKILFFYGFPELVQLRSEILQNIYQLPQSSEE